MSKFRVTPLNIVSALVLTWLAWQLIDDQLEIGLSVWILLLLLVTVVGDQFFRLALRSMKRVWIVEGIFVVLVVIVIWVIRIW